MVATLDAPRAPIRPPTAPPRRRFWQFSLFSLCLLVGMGCLVGAWVGERRQRRETEDRLRAKEAENRQYRIDLGLLDDRPGMLVVDDTTQVHVRLLPSLEATQWRWRLYLPPGKQWRLVNEQGEDGYEVRGAFRESGSRTTFDEGGQITLEAKIDREEDGKANVLVLGDGWRDQTAVVSSSGADRSHAVARLAP
jgi:hypothetical protein